MPSFMALRKISGVAGETMPRPRYFVVIDIASETFTSAAGVEPWRLTVKPQQFANELDSFPQFVGWLQEHGLERETTVLCMEATGCMEKAGLLSVCQRYRLAVEPLRS
jgi:hypothetical protein